MVTHTFLVITWSEMFSFLTPVPGPNFRNISSPSVSGFSGPWAVLLAVLLLSVSSPRDLSPQTPRHLSPQCRAVMELSTPTPKGKSLTHRRPSFLRFSTKALLSE